MKRGERRSIRRAQSAGIAWVTHSFRPPRDFLSNHFVAERTRIERSLGRSLRVESAERVGDRVLVVYEVTDRDD